MEIKTDKFNIEFIEEIKIALYLLYKIRIKCNKKAYLDISKITCNLGVNFACTNINTLCNKQLLQSKEMRKNEEIEGYIAFHKYNIATNKSTIFYDGEFIKVKMKSGV